MKKIAFMFMLLPCAAMAETDAGIALNDVLNNVRANCGGISAELAPLKKMAGIGTAVNAAGTLVGAGGVAVGIAKSNVDKTIMANKLKELEKDAKNKQAAAEYKAKAKNINWDELEQKFDAKVDALLEQHSEDDDYDADMAKADIQKQSTTLGHVRTGLFATNTATSVTGAVLSSKTRVDETLDTKIKACADGMNQLRTALARVRAEDGDKADTEMLNRGQNILDKCSEYANVDTDSLNKLAKGGVVTGSVGAATGLAATITSIMGNKSISTVESDEEGGKVKEIEKIKNTNTASNVLGGVNAVSSLTGTVLNATQIKKIKDVITLSENCEEALQ